MCVMFLLWCLACSRHLISLSCNDYLWKICISLSSLHVPHLSLFLIRTKGAYVVEVSQMCAVSVVNATIPDALFDLRGKTIWWFRAALSPQLYFVLDIAPPFTHLAICEDKINLFANLRLSEKLKNYTSLRTRQCFLVHL